VQQVEHALRLGYLGQGDRLPTVKEVVSADAAGLDEAGMVALFTSALRDFHDRRGEAPVPGSRDGGGQAGRRTAGGVA
jgi:hypothetical protein